MTEKTSFTYKLSGAQQSALKDLLKSGNYEPIKVEHTIIAAKTPDCSISLYKSGKCLIQGKGASDFVTFILEPCVLLEAQLGYEDVLNPEQFQPHMGIDESGKGDFFGPLVIAGAYVDKDIIEKMTKMNVRDSKQVTSDKVALDMGRDIRKLLGNRFSLIKIGPEAYNRLYSRMRNVNSILGWAHARAIENLLEKVPSCPKAISDQFGRKEQVEKALMKKGQKIQLVQMHKAEADIAVAAASILAREAFLRSLYSMGQEHETEFKKGASEAVRETAEKIVAEKGPDILVKVAKCHFKTTDEVLKKVGMDRKSLPPEGRVKSKPPANSYRKT